MRQYCKLSDLSSETLKEIFAYFFNRCNKVNIYFPNEASEDIVNFKNKFLKAMHIIEMPEELSSIEEPLKEKEGYLMVIASLTEEIKAFILNLDLNFRLSLGLITKDNKVLFYIGDEDECIIEDNEDSSLFSSSLFSGFKPI